VIPAVLLTIAPPTDVYAKATSGAAELLAAGITRHQQHCIHILAVMFRRARETPGKCQEIRQEDGYQHHV